MRLEKSKFNPIYYNVEGDHIPNCVSVKISVGGTEAEHDGSLREGIENCIVNRVNRTYEGLEYHRAIHPGFDEWPISHRLYVLLSDHGDTLHLDDLIKDLVAGVPEYRMLWLSVKAKQYELVRKMLMIAEDGTEGE